MNNAKLFAIVLSPNNGRTMRIMEAGSNALDAALELHREWPRCDVYLCAAPPATATKADMDAAWSYWPDFDDELKKSWARSW